MAQGYQDNETGAFWVQFFQEDSEEKLKEKMDELKKEAEKTSTLVAEETGETLKDAREKLRDAFRKQLYENRAVRELEDKSCTHDFADMFNQGGPTNLVCTKCGKGAE